MFEGPCTDSSPKLLPESTQHIRTLHCCPSGEIWEQDTRPNYNTSGRTVYRATGGGGEYGHVGDRIYTLTKQAYSDLAPALLQSLAVPAFLKGLRDRNAAQEAMKFRDPKSIQEAVVTVTHIQGASRIFGNRGVSTVRQVSFEDKPTTEAPSTDMDRLQGVIRQLQQLAVTNKVTPTSDACYTCGGCIHRSRDCANKRRRSPSPLTCFECSGEGHIASECSNRLRRRKETVRTRHKHQYRSSSSSSNNSSVDSDSDDSRIRRRNHRHRPRWSHHRHGNYQNSRRSPRCGDRSHGHGARQADHIHDGSDTSRGREYDRAKYQSRDDVKTSDYNSQNPHERYYYTNVEYNHTHKLRTV